MQNWSEKNKYTIYGVLFGLCFPLGAILFLYFTHALGMGNWIEIIRNAHDNRLLYLIDTAPVFLGLVARCAGTRQDRIHQFLNTLEKQVQDKTESLRLALEESRHANELIGHMADHDALTGLLNRRRFQKTLEDWMEYAARYGRQGTLLFIDLDKFKFVNDTYGHNAGDQYLNAVAELLTQKLRATDIVARWGGDEFAAFLPETVGSEAHLVGNKLLAGFAQLSFCFGGELFQASASIGLAFVPEHASTTNELIMYADAAMYEAKKAGRGCWRLYGASSTEIQHVQAHLQWEARIRRALENDQFLLLYQPLLNLKSGRTDGYEALLRMEDSNGHLISPGQFLESAERANLSSSIDLMVIRKAARRVVPLIDHAEDVGVSINLSPKTLLDKNLIEKIEAILQEYPGLNSKLRFEVSEATALQNLALTRSLAAQIRELGCLLILDDFGLGPASLQYLEKLSIDMVKIHPSLIRGLKDNPKNLSFVKNLTEMLHGFHLKVGAKSVEDTLLLDILRDIGIDYAQGFAIGKPLESLEQTSNDSAPMSEQLW
ncbi:MAG: EAL domain-containing protein [Pseudomonadota bacterium]